MQAQQSTKPNPTIYLLHPNGRTKLICQRGHAAHSLIKKGGYTEISKERYEARSS